MATTTLIFPNNPFTVGDTNYRLQEPSRIDDRRNSLAKQSPGSKQMQGGSGTGVMDEWFDLVEDVPAGGEQAAEAGAYLGTRINVYA
jgi:hypothetical protein